MKRILSLLFYILLVSISLAQNSIEGAVIDHNNQPIFFATVAMYTSNDTVLVDGQSTDSQGQFMFEGLADGSYMMIVSMLGFEDFVTDKFTIPRSQMETFSIRLIPDATMLDLVEITEKLPLLEQKADKLIVNVEGNVTNTGGSLLDVMKKVPGMIVVNDRLRLAGSGSPTILINGKSTQYMDIQSLLRDMPGDNIKTVEIIHQPGSEYEASGSGPILNIILKRNSLFGTNGNVSLGIGKGELWDYTTGLNVSHFAGNVNVMGGLGLGQNAYVDGLEITRRLSNIGADVNGTYDQISRDAATPLSFRSNVRVEWDMSDKHRIGLDAKYYNNENQRVSTNRTEIDLTDLSKQDYQLNTNNDIDRSWNYLSINPYYTLEIDTAGEKLEIDFNYASYQVDGFNILSTTSSISTDIAQQRYTQPGDTKIFATEIDYSKPLSKIFEIKIGGKYSVADLDNNLISEYALDEKWVNNTNQSNHYLFEEKVYAGYGKLEWAIGEWAGTAGLRYENSQSVGRSITIDSMLSRDISQFFPSFSISRKIGKSLGSALSYSYRINRPSYSTLNPFVYYLDPFTYETGNPNILPELTHSAKFTLTFDGQPFFNIEYKESDDAIVEVTQQETDSEEAFKIDVNFDKRTSLSGTLMFPLSFIPGIDGYGGVILTQTNYNSIYQNAVFKRERLSTTAFIQVEFNLPGDIEAEIGAWYQGRSQEGIFDAEYLYGTSAGLSRKFMNNRAKVSIGIEDFANRFWYAHVNYQQDMDLVSTWQAPVVSFRFSYKFGNQFLNTKKGRSGAAADEVRRATSD